MGVTSDFDWRGIEQVIRNAGADVEGQLAAFVARQAKAYCPVATGRLVNSIQVTPDPDGFGTSVVVASPYAALVESGHMTDAGFVPPNPFVRLALADAVRELPAIVGRNKI